MKKNAERAYSEFLEGLQTAITEDDFRRVAERAAHAWGFRWFAYFGRQVHGPNLISSYPKCWTDHYLLYGPVRIGIHQEPSFVRDTTMPIGVCRAAYRAPELRYGVGNASNTLSISRVEPM